MSTKPHKPLRNAGDEYAWDGVRVTMNREPVAELELDKGTPALPHSTFVPMGPRGRDELEQRAIGWVLLGWCSIAELRAGFREPLHEPLLAALAAIDFGACPSPRDRVELAVRACRAAGVDPVLCGSEELPVGYLVGCVRSAQAVAPPNEAAIASFLAAPVDAAPADATTVQAASAHVTHADERDAEEADDPAEQWNRATA